MGGGLGAYGLAERHHTTGDQENLKVPNVIGFLARLSNAPRKADYIFVTFGDLVYLSSGEDANWTSRKWKVGELYAFNPQVKVYSKVPTSTGHSEARRDARTGGAVAL